MFHSKTLRLWEDKEAILSKIGPSPEIAKFNERLQQLLLGSKGLLAGWLDGQKLLQEVGTIAARARARCQREQISVTAPNNPTDSGEAPVVQEQVQQVPVSTKIHLWVAKGRLVSVPETVVLRLSHSVFFQRTAKTPKAFLDSFWQLEFE